MGDFRNGDSALHWAAAQGHSDVIATLADRGADIVRPPYKPKHLKPVSVLVGLVGLFWRHYRIEKPEKLVSTFICALIAPLALLTVLV